MFKHGSEMLGRNEAIGILNEFCNLLPVDTVAVGVVEKHAKPIAQRSAGRSPGLIEACRPTGGERFGDAREGWTHQACPTTIIEVVVVEVAQRSLVTDEEARRAMAQTLVHLRQGKSNRAESAKMIVAHTCHCRIPHT
jgi:hypothetical protein